MASVVPYSIKDFRDAANYPEWRGINAWRWEFLRRNPDYQEFHAQHKDDERVPDCRKFGIRSLIDPRMDAGFQGMTPPARIVELPTFEWVERWKKVPGYTAERGIAMLLRTLTELQERGDTLVAINRALPLEPQLDAIREAVGLRNDADGTKPALGRDRRDEWPFYLRILDALSVGTSHDEIAAVLYPGTENLYPDYAGRRRVKKAAERAAFLASTFAVKGFAPGK